MNRKPSSSERYCLKSGNDNHWYLVPLKQSEEFDNLIMKAFDADNYDYFEQVFGKRRIDGVESLTFAFPEIS